MAVHMYGGVCDMPTIMDIAKRHGLPVVEDCAQCVLGQDNLGRKTGTIGAIGIWSFENSKQLTCGDGGIAACNDEDLATKVRKIGGLGYKTLTAATGGVRTDRSKFQDPNWERFDTIGFNYRMSELCAAVALAQTERIQHFIDLRCAMAEGYRCVLAKSKLLRPQHQPEGYVYTYYTFSAEFCGEEHGISWHDFRAKYIEHGGDGIYAALKLLYQESIFRDQGIGRGDTPVAAKLQRRLMNFTTNQANAKEREMQLEALAKTLLYFGDEVCS
jgi:perosamine synthetase